MPINRKRREVRDEDYIDEDLRWDDEDGDEDERPRKSRRRDDDDEDERPRRKSRRRDDEDDEDDEDERPRRKSRRRDDDDDEDEEPRRKSRRRRDDDDEDDEDEDERPRKKSRRRDDDEDEDEDERPRKKSRRTRDDEEEDDPDPDDEDDKSSLIQSGWSAAKKVMSEATSYTDDFRFEEEVQVVKFLGTEPMVYQQHWIDRKGKRSFVCLGKNCPLCKAGSETSAKYAWPILNFGVEGAEDQPVTQLLVCGTKLAKQLEKHDQSDRNGPLDRLYWALSKTGKNQSTSYVLEPVKERDLSDDWEIDPDEAAEAVESAKVPGEEAITVTSRSDLLEIAREMR